MNVPLLFGLLVTVISLAKSESEPEMTCQPQTGVCTPGSMNHGCPGGALASCNVNGQCCVTAVDEIPDGVTCPGNTLTVPDCLKCTAEGGVCNKVGTYYCCGKGGGIVAPPGTPPPAQCTQTMCTTSSDCTGLSGGIYDCSEKGQCCTRAINGGTSGLPGSTQLQRCQDVSGILATALQAPTCLGYLQKLLSPTSTVNQLCLELLNGLECVAVQMVGENLKTQCVDSMFSYLKENPTAIFDQMKAIVGEVAINAEFKQSAYKCREIVRDSSGGQIGTTTMPDMQDWNTKCPAIPTVARAGQCVGGCAADDECTQVGDVCCTAPNSCPVCVPDLRQCTDPDAFLISALTCLTDFAALAQDLDFDNFCLTLWKGVRCVAGNILTNKDYSKLCLERIARLLKESPESMLKEVISTAKGYGITLRALEKYGMNVSQCKESPLYEPPKRPVPEDVNVCTNVTTIMKSFRQCLGSMSLASRTESNAVCSDLNETVNCVARGLLRQTTDDYETKQCAGEVHRAIMDNAERFKTMLGTLNANQCEERTKVCGGDMQPSDAYYCRDRACPTGYDCKGGYCCPSERAGMCPMPRGTPICKRKCTKDSECDDGDKCCNIGCGYKSCTRLETREKSQCEMEFDNARKQLELNGICGDGKSVLTIPRCQNSGYFPTQGDIQHGRMYCVTETGNKIPGSDFVGNIDCTTVRPGVCPVRPQVCAGGPQLEQCRHDYECNEREKCCFSETDKLCVKKCLQAERAPAVRVDDCPNRQCCPITLCQNRVCAKDKTAVCRINSCGGCNVEFYNVRGEKVDCESDVPLCERKRAEAQRMNAERGKSDADKLAAFVRASEKMGGMQDDMNGAAEDRMGGMDASMDHEDGMEDMIDEYGERRDGIERLPNDTSRGEDMDDAETRQMLQYKLDRFCMAFMTYNICRNNGICSLGKGESPWEICDCPTGYHGLFCENNGTVTPMDTQCYRDAERISAMLRVLTRADHVREKMILHELFGILRPSNGLIPNYTCAGSNFKSVQQAMTYPKTSDALNIFYCAHVSNGSKIMGTPVTLVMSGATPNCSVTGLMPDPLRLPRRCLSASKGNCTSGTCQYFWNQITGKCQQGMRGNGFRTLTECYDVCAVTKMCEEPPTSNSECKPLLGPIPCRITIGGIQVSQCNFSRQFCDVSSDNDGVCKDFPAHCQLQPDAGYGEKQIGAYYYSVARRRCEKFQYNGSGGNSNRFYSLHQCQTECRAQQYKYQEVVCPIPKALPLKDALMSDMCDDDYSCPDNDVCCSNGMVRICTSPVVACNTGERCSLDGACVNGRCVCRECDNSTVDPVCGSNGKTYDNICFLRRDACLTMQPLKSVSNGPCNVVCGASRCKQNQQCVNNQCTCNYACGASNSPVCGRGMTSGAYRTFDNECQMKKQACDMDEIYVKIHDGVCDSSGGTCLIPCTKEYRPVCAYDTTAAVPKLTNYSNICEMRRDAICNKTKLEVLYDGPCNRQCGSVQCNLHEECINGKCACPMICTLEYAPICGYPMGNPGKLTTFSNGCQMRAQSCIEKSIYVIHSKGPCESPEQELLCPETDPYIPFSAEIGCNKNTNAYCNIATEMCCPYGAGTRCVPKTALIRPGKTKGGVCPLLSALNFDKSSCAKLWSRDDGDCAGQAKSCWNMICGHNTCTEPIVRPDANLCPANYMMISQLSCDPSQTATGCPRNSVCKSVNTTSQMETGVCCMPTSQTPASADELLSSRICEFLDFLGIRCQNGGTCVGNLRNGTICACAPGYFGPLCGSSTPPGSCGQPVQCLVNPCDVTSCPGVPEAVCESNYCGGCNTIFRNNSLDVSHLCQATPCLRKRAVVKRILDAVHAGMGSSKNQNDVEEGMNNLMDTDSVTRNLMDLLEKMGVHGIPVNGEISCAERGHYDAVQCSWFKDRNATNCYCVDPRGEKIPNGPKSLSRDTLDCSAFREENIGLQTFCLQLPNTTMTCSASESVRFFFNPATMDCEAFTDTGCSTDLKNNFNSYETCKSACGVQSNILSMCARARCGNSQQCRVRDGIAECVGPEADRLFEPVCDAEGMFEPKQCQGQVCRCVDPVTGQEVPNSVADGAALECVKEGQTVRPLREGEKKCDDNTDRMPQFCENGGDQCNNCASRGPPGTSSQGNGQTAGNNVCISCERCYAGQVLEDCGLNDPCKNSECKSDSTAVCRVNKCTCRAEFVSGGRVIDCSKVQSQCLKEKGYIEAEERSRVLSYNGKVPTDVVQLKCSASGAFEVKCVGNSCRCLNATSGEAVGDPVIASNINTINCNVFQSKTKAKRLKVSLKVTDKPLEQLSTAQKDQIKRKLKEAFEARVPVVVQNITLYSGSTKADLDIENCMTGCQAQAETTDLPSLVGAVISEIGNGAVQITAEGETFTPTAAAITGISTAEELDGPASEKPTESDDNKTKIIIIVVVVVGVCFIVAIVVAIYCYKKANRSKTKDIPFTDIKGQENPTYQN